jgi:multiple sugar transport system permease protein
MRTAKAKGYNWWTMPAVLLTVFVSILPWLVMIWNSFFDKSYTKISAGSFIGFDNYRTALASPDFLGSVWNTFKIILVALPIEFLMGLFIAFLVSQHLRMRKFVVPIIIIPMIIAPTVVGLIWGLNLNPNFGPVGVWLSKIGFATQGLLASEKTALWTITGIDIWQWTPFMFLLFLSGLVGLPRAPLEAAAVDGASGWQVFKRITLPGLKPIFIVAFLLRFTDLYKIFDVVWITTVGGPGNATETMSTFGYRVNFLYWHIGYGAAVVMIIYLISQFVSTIFFNLTSGKTQENVL